MALDDDARAAHVTADAAPAIQALLRGLRLALSTGSPIVEIPVVLVDQQGVQARAGAVRKQLMEELEQLVTGGDVGREEAQVLIERFALDGELRRGQAILDQHRFGRETMRARYQSALEALADRIARMPLTLRPPVALDDAEREVVVATVLSSERTTACSDPAFLRYVHKRVRQRVLGHERVGPPGQGRVDDRRWQRAADRLAAVAEDHLDRGIAIPTLEPADAQQLEQVRAWIERGRPIEQARPELSLALMRVALHDQHGDLALTSPTQEEADTPQEVGLDFEAAFVDLALPWQLAALKTARRRASSARAWATAALLHYYLAESLGERAFPDAAEHVMRAVTGPLKRLLLQEPPDIAFLTKLYRVRRFHARCELHLGRGPAGLYDLRATLRSFAEYATGLGDDMDFYEAIRLYHTLLNAEIAAALAGADPDEARDAFDEVESRITRRADGLLDEAVARSLRRAREDLDTLWARDPTADRRAIAARLATRLSGPDVESKVGSNLVVERWTNRR